MGHFKYSPTRFSKKFVFPWSPFERVAYFVVSLVSKGNQESVGTKLEIALSRTDHFFGNGLSSTSFLFPPNVKHDVLDLSFLNRSEQSTNAEVP